MKIARSDFGFEVTLTHPALRFHEGVLKTDADATDDIGEEYKVRVGRFDGPSFVGLHGDEVYDLERVMIFVSPEGDVHIRQTGLTVPMYSLSELTRVD